MYQSCVGKLRKSFTVKVQVYDFQRVCSEVLALLKARELGLDPGDITTLEE
jgi:hypothetical protein